MASLFGALRSTLGTKLFISGAAGAATLTALQSGWLKVKESCSHTSGSCYNLMVTSHQIPSQTSRCSLLQFLIENHYRIFLAWVTLLFRSGLCLVSQDARAEQAPPAGALDPNEWRSFKVVSKDVITHNTSRLRCEPPCLSNCCHKLFSEVKATLRFCSHRFATPDPNQTSGLFVASCLLTRAPIGAKKEDGTQKFVIRPYTPTSAPDQKGHFDLVGSPIPLPVIHCSLQAILYPSIRLSLRPIS